MKTFTILLSTFFLGLSSMLSAQTNHVVQMIDYEFSPSSITISVGDMVTWRNNGSEIHTSTSGDPCTPDGIWDSDSLQPGDTFQFTFTSPGDYPYFCIPHCDNGMTGSVKVTGSIGIDDITKNKDFKIWPQPVADMVNFRITTSINDNIEVKIFSPNGQTIKHIIRKAQSTSEQFNIDLSNYSDGVYLYQLKIGDKPAQIGKIVKQSGE